MNEQPMKTDFLDLVPPVTEPKTKSVTKKRQNKILPEWTSDPEPILGIATNEYKRWRALGSDASHDATVQEKKRREDSGLPRRRQKRKEKLAPSVQIQTAILKELGFDLSTIQPGTPEYEEMLRALDQSTAYHVDQYSSDGHTEYDSPLAQIKAKIEAQQDK